VTAATARRAAATDADIADAYSAAATSWRGGPAVVYERLAAVVVAHSPVSLRDADVIDIGAGTGAASYAALNAGARRVLAVDAAAGMLAIDAPRRPPSIVADATHLPVAATSFDVALAAFSFNHLYDPAAGFLEAARVVKRDGAIVASAYAADDRHPVKEAVEQALRDQGWTPQPWQTEMYRARAPLLATVDRCAEVVRSAGLDATITKVRVGFPNLTARQWVTWRLGMAQHAPFVAALAAHQRQRVVSGALHRLGNDAPPLVRSIMIIAVRC